MGFADMLADLGEPGADGRQDVPDEPVPDDVESRCKQGEIWVLGEHRVMCGSATSEDDMAALAGGSC